MPLTLACNVQATDHYLCPMSGKNTLLIGRGISGAVLSFRLMEHGIPHDIIDEPSLSRSSRIAAGLMNPVVLKRLRLVQGAQSFLENAPSFYLEWEQRLQKSFYHPTPLHHVFTSQGEVNEWMEKSTLPIFEDLLGPVSNMPHPQMPAAFGVGELRGCGWLDTEEFLEAHEGYFANFGNLINKRIEESDLDGLKEEYSRIIICNGHLMRELFPDLDLFRPTRGEVISIRTKDMPQDSIRHGRVFIMPLGEQNFKVGATYHWDELRDITTADGLNQLVEGLEKLFKGHYEIIQHQGGVRPNVKDRKPLLGKIPGYDIYSFNGMGSRAVLMTPFLSRLMLDFLFKDSGIPGEYDIRRF